MNDSLALTSGMKFFPDDQISIGNAGKRGNELTVRDLKRCFGERSFANAFWNRIQLGLNKGIWDTNKTAKKLLGEMSWDDLHNIRAVYDRVLIQREAQRRGGTVASASNPETGKKLDSFALMIRGEFKRRQLLAFDKVNALHDDKNFNYDIVSTTQTYQDFLKKNPGIESTAAVNIENYLLSRFTSHLANMVVEGLDLEDYKKGARWHFYPELPAPEPVLSKEEESLEPKDDSSCSGQE